MLLIILAHYVIKYTIPLGIVIISVYYVLWYNLGIHEREYLCMKMNIYAICIQCIFMQSDEYLCTGTPSLYLEIFRYEITPLYNSLIFMT